jgi:hypothetical protein
LLSLALVAGCAGGEPERGAPGVAQQARLPLRAAASMSVARAYHTATRLLDGRVLVAGGTGEASAELYDPATDTWAPAASMGTIRQLHTATLLADGRVLVVGGSPELRAELYDPALDAWTATPPMALPRPWRHATTRLLDGRVLVAGGGEEATFTCEIYDPVTGEWHLGARLPRGGYGNSDGAALLADGRVFLDGNEGPYGEHRGQIYDPASDAWSTMGARGDMRMPGATVTLLPGGRILVAGAGDLGPETLLSADIYDPATGSWTPVPRATPSFGVWNFSGQRAVSLPDGQVLLTGGIDYMLPCDDGAWPCPSVRLRDSTEIYEPTAGRFTAGPSMLSPRGHHTATLLLDGRVLLAGGLIGDHDGATGDNVVAIASAELFTLERRRPGEPCSSAAECGGGSERCVDGVCCSSACDGACEACAVAAGAAQDGVCAPVTGPACDDGDACTQGDACQAGACDGAPASDGAPCDDGDACTQGDACQAGACTGAPASDGAPCDDGDACTRIDTCQAGACAGADPVACAAADTCHLSLCDPASGQCIPALAPGGTACDDGDLCTQDDACQTGACVGTPVSCTATDACHAAACDEATGLCADAPLPDGTPCGERCTDSACQAGVCTTGAPTVCPAVNGCHQPGFCDRYAGSGGACQAGPRLPDGAPCSNPTTSAWTAGSPMETGRGGHAATLLQDGTVLVTGGLAGHVQRWYGASDPRFDSAMRYDPANDTWTAVRPMLQPRAYHTATLLQDGTVLVVGGTGDAAQGPSAERYDPRADVWTVTGATVAPERRDRHTATLLQDGKVLVLGGIPDWASSEIYDPATNTWAPTAPMLDLRLGFFTATLLQDGRVLVVGTRDGGRLFDPATNTWAPAGPPDGRDDLTSGVGWTWDVPMPVSPRRLETVTQLADGRVLVLGGCENDAYWCGFADVLLYAPGVISPGDGVCQSGACVTVDAGGSGGAGGEAGSGGAGGEAGSGGAGGEAGSGGAGGDGGVNAGGSASTGGAGVTASTGAATGAGGAGGAGGSGGAAPGAGGQGGAGGGGTGGSGDAAVASGTGGASTSAAGAGGSPGSSGPAGGGSGGCSASPRPVGSAAPWLLLAALLGARGARRRTGCSAR